jgi:cell wall-associated NlpC family hydrolase
MSRMPMIVDMSGIPPVELPRGAFVFFDMTGELFDVTTNYGHVGLCLCDGRIVHAWDEVRIDDIRAVEALESAEGWTQPRYTGWAPVERILQGHQIGQVQHPRPRPHGRGCLVRRQWLLGPHPAGT